MVGMTNTIQTHVCMSMLQTSAIYRDILKAPIICKEKSQFFPLAILL
jgi:hypothetical protein